MLDIYLLEHLAAFAECGTLSAASEKLHLSQSALSRSMQKLEECLAVKLFTRQKNKLTLTENGTLAAQYALRILALEQDMITKIRDFDRKNRTISVGCCAPVPLEGLMPLLTYQYPEMTITSELNYKQQLLDGLSQGTYQLIVAPEEPTDKDLYALPCGNEQLYISLPPAHPLANYPSLYLKDLDSQSFLLYSKIGFWYELCIQKMPHAKFLMQNERDVFLELVEASALPSFTSDITIKHSQSRPNRINVLLRDSEASVTYYLICKKSDKKFFQAIFEKIQDANLTS